MAKFKVTFTKEISIIVESESQNDVQRTCDEMIRFNEDPSDLRDEDWMIDCGPASENEDATHTVDKSDNEFYFLEIEKDK